MLHFTFRKSGSGIWHGSGRDARQHALRTHTLPSQSRSLSATYTYALLAALHAAQELSLVIMDVTKAVSAYIQRMITEVAGIKVLLLDQDTTPIISTSFTQSSLLSHEVYLTDRVDNSSRDRMRHLNCVALLRPTPQSIAALTNELRQPRYKSYWLYFTNVLQKQDIEALAEADEHEVVKEIQEFFADYLPVNSDLFSLNIDTPPSRIWAENLPPGTTGLDQHVKGLFALLLSLKKKPVIRYERMSSLARKLGEELSVSITPSRASLY